MFIILTNAVDFVLRIIFRSFYGYCNRYKKYIDFLDTSTSKKNIAYIYIFVKR